MQVAFERIELGAQSVKQSPVRKIIVPTMIRQDSDDSMRRVGDRVEEMKQGEMSQVDEHSNDASSSY